MKLVRIIIEGILTAKARGAFLLILSAGVGCALYAGLQDSTSASTPADGVTIPPLVRAEPTESPPASLTRVIPETMSRPLDAPASPPDRATLVRALQTVLLRAQCYDGRITGDWNSASKSAMGTFLAAVNAQLPVEEPDQALLALVDSNASAKCSTGRAINTGSLSSHDTLPAATPRDRPAREAAIAPAAPLPNASDRPADQPSMIERAWAPPEMLIPPKIDNTPAGAAAATAAQPLTIGTAEQTASVSAPSKPPEATAPPAKPTIAPVVVRFQSVSVEPDPGLQAAPPPPQQKVAQRKKTRRRPADDGFSFQSIQKSISSMFD